MDRHQAPCCTRMVCIACCISLCSTMISTVCIPPKQSKTAAGPSALAGFSAACPGMHSMTQRFVPDYTGTFLHVMSARATGTSTFAGCCCGLRTPVYPPAQLAAPHSDSCATPNKQSTPESCCFMHTAHDRATAALNDAPCVLTHPNNERPAKSSTLARLVIRDLQRGIVRIEKQQ